ncbi:MAG: aminotransferase class I/II-fold pyridoxal phosphate-dependent enzyme [Flavobacteriaceae bacterium]
MIKKSTRLNNVKEYYFASKLKEIRALIKQGKPIINLGIGSPDLAPPKKAIDAIAKAVLSDKNHSYRSYQGLPEFRESIAKFYEKQFSVSLNPNNEILPLMGSKEGIMHISMAFLNEGDHVLIPNPGYITYTSVTELLKAKPIYYTLKEATNWLPNFEELEKLNLKKVKIMWVNYPHMPTGEKGNKVLFEKLIAFAKKHEILVVNDNPYSFVLNNNPLSILSIKGAKDVAIELNSLSKTFNMAGWRVGMVLGKKDYLKTILQVKSNMDSGMFYGIQKGAIAALDVSDKWFDKLNSIYSKRREIVWQILDELHCEYDKNIVGLFVWGKIPKGEKSEKLTDKLLYKNDIFITPGTVFGTNGEGYIRISLCVDEETLKDVLRRLKV